MYSIVAGLLPPILIAIALNETRNVHVKKSVQMAVYAPYFLSTVIVTSMLIPDPFDQRYREPVHPALRAAADSVSRRATLLQVDLRVVRSVAVLRLWSGDLPGCPAGINPELYESARVDGVSKWQQIRYIDIPGILPGGDHPADPGDRRVFDVGFEKVLLLQNPMNMSSSDVIDTFVYRQGLVNFEYSYSTAVNLFKSVANLIC